MGCNRIGEYFPNASLAPLPLCPIEAARLIASLIEQNRWESSLPAINEARERVLYKYGLFPYLAKLIEAHELRDAFDDKAQDSTISPVSPSIFETWVRSRTRATIVNARSSASSALAKISGFNSHPRNGCSWNNREMSWLCKCSYESKI